MAHRRMLVALVLVASGGLSAQTSTESLREQVFGKRAEREQTLAADLDLNGQRLDPVDVKVKGHRLTDVDLSQLRDRLADVLEQTALDCLQQPHEDPLALAQRCGIAMRYDPGKLIVFASIEPGLRRIQNLQLRPRREATAAGEAAVSAYLNLNAAVRRSAQDDERFEDRGLGLDGAVRAFGATLEFDGLCTEGRCVPGLRSLVYDRPDELRRWRLGDLTEARAGGLFLPALRGLSVGTSFDLAPNESFTPNLDAPLELQQPAKVEVLVNGRIVQSYDLPPGRYRLSDFPLGFGANAAELRITDAAGRTESRFIEAFVDLALLEAGRVRHSVSVGQIALPALLDNAIVQPWVLAADYSRGLGPRTTFGLGAASIPELQQHNIAISLTQAWGRWLTGAALACAHGNTQGCRADLRWRLAADADAMPGWQHEGALGWRQSGYAELLSASAQGARTLQAQWRSSRTIRDRHQLTLGARAQWSGDPSSEYALSAQWASRFGRGLGLRIGIEQADVSGTVDRRINVSFNWLFDEARQALQVEAESELSRYGARWQFNRQNQRGGYIANLGESRSDLGAVRDGAIGWRHERAGADLAIAQSSAPDGTASRDTRLAVRTALVFADGVFGITEQVQGSFALIDPWDSHAAGTVYVNPVEDDYLASSLGPGPAVVANLRAYEPRALALSLPELPADRDPGNLFPVVRPGYKGGAVVAAGGRPTIGLLLQIVDTSGKPLSMVAGQLLPEAGGNAMPVFVGRDGRLRAQGLIAGDWQLTLQTRPIRRHLLHIPADARGTIDLGTLSP